MNEVHNSDVARFLKNAFKVSDFGNIEAVLQDRPYQEFAQFMRTKYTTPKLQELLGIVNEEAMKDDKLSEEHRKLGNAEFQNSNYEKCLYYYHRAQAFASTDEARALSYGNISAALLNTRHYEGCLEAISSAKKLHNKDDDYTKKLADREAKCKALVRESQNQQKIELTYSANPKNPEIVNCIERRSGGIFAKQDLNATDIIAITKPLVDGPNRKEWFFCDFCRTDTTTTSVFPCVKCPLVMYCSKECQSQDQLFHGFICGNVHNFITRLEYMALKFAVNMMSKGIDIRKKNFENPSKTCFDWSEGTLEEKVESLCAMKSISICIIQNRTKFDILVMIFIYIERMKGKPVFVEFLKKFHNGEELLFKSYWKSFQIIYSNSKMIGESSPKSFEPFYCDLLTGFFNHSCVSNVIHCRNTLTGETYYVIGENVKKGQELFISYG